MTRLSVGDVMTRSVVSVVDTTPYKEIVELLSQHAISAVPVVDERQHVLGLVSEADLLHKLEYAGIEPHLHLLERKRQRTARAKAASDLAADLMTSPAITVGLGDSISSAARLMDEARVKRLPVVDGEGRLVGIVSRRDLLRLYLRPDEAIRDEIIEQVLMGTMWLEPGTITVNVEGGVVSLAGTVERRSTMPIVVRLVEAVTGVVEVVDNLTYRYDDEPDRRVRYPTAKDVLPGSG